MVENYLGRIQWVKTQWRVLFDITSWNKIRIWEVDLKRLLRSLLEELKKMQLFDFISSGIALYSAATLHRMKTERLLEADVPTVLKERPKLTLPPPIFLPIKAEFLTTTIMDLIEALREAISETKVVKQDVVEQSTIDIEDFVMKIEERVEEFTNFIKELLREKQVVQLEEIIMDSDRLEIVRKFILLLFIASRNVVTIFEDENGRILVTLGES